MGRLKKTTISWIAIILLIYLFPILPQYVYITRDLNVVNFVSLVFVSLIILCGKIYKWHLPILMLPYFIYTGVYSIMYFVEAGILQTGAYVITSIVIPFLIVGLVNTRYRFYKVIDVLISAGFLLAIIGLIESILQMNFIQLLANVADISFFYEVRYGFLRIMTTFGQPIAYGLYQVFTIALILYRLNTQEMKGKKRIYLYVCHVLCALNVIFSVSRIPIIACVILYLLLLYKKSEKRFVNYAVIGVVLIFFVMLFKHSVNMHIPIISNLLESTDGLISGEQFTSPVGVGDRFDLWLWVYLSMGNSWVFGKGITTEFAYKVNEWNTKTSIENQYLNILYHNGIVGLVTLVLSYLTTLIYAKKCDRRYGCAFGEKQLSFNGVVFVMLFIYFMCEFGVQETDMTRTYSIWIALLISYNRIVELENRFRLENH